MKWTVLTRLARRKENNNKKNTKTKCIFKRLNDKKHFKFSMAKKKNLWSHRPAWLPLQCLLWMQIGVQERDNHVNTRDSMDDRRSAVTDAEVQNYAPCSETHFVKIRRTVSSQSAMEILISTMTLTSLMIFLITTGFLNLWRTSLQKAVIIFITIMNIIFLFTHLFGMSVGHHFLTKLHNLVSSHPSLYLSSVSLHPSDLMV